MKGLYVEDDLSLAQTVIDSLKDKGVDVVWTRSIKDSLTEIERQRFSFFIIDLGLTDGEGFEIAKVLKDKNNKAPVLFLTARSGAEDRLKGYELGATEYIPKPFLFAELWIRLEHALSEHAQEESVVLGELTVHPHMFLFKWSSGEVQELTEKEMGVFLALYQASPKVLRRSDILDQVWGKENFPSERTIDNIILKLRTYLKDQSFLVKSVRGVGYALRND